MFIVQKGKVQVDLYSDKKIIRKIILLKKGDAIVLIHGIHAIKVLEDMQCISVKQGPFLGPEFDKVIIKKTKMIPVFKPIISSTDKKAALSALDKGEISGTYGKSIINLEKKFSKYIGTKYAVSVTSGSTALHLSIAALELPKGSEIIVSSTTNIASGLAITHKQLYSGTCRQ